MPRGGASEDFCGEGCVGRTRSGGLESGELSALAGLFEFSVAVVVDDMGQAVEHVMRSDVSDGRMQPHGVVMFDEVGDTLSGLVERSGTCGSDAFAFE